MEGRGDEEKCVCGGSVFCFTSRTTTPIKWHANHCKLSLSVCVCVSLAVRLSLLADLPDDVQRGQFCPPSWHVASNSGFWNKSFTMGAGYGEPRPVWTGLTTWHLWTRGEEQTACDRAWSRVCAPPLLKSMRMCDSHFTHPCQMTVFILSTSCSSRGSARRWP